MALWRSELSVAGPELKSIFDVSYGSAARTIRSAPRSRARASDGVAG